MTCNSAVPKDANKSCLKKLEIDEGLLEFKLETTKKELHQRYNKLRIPKGRFSC
jgi:hypothetical protein